ncbi:MAG TPA: ATP-binding cassette domain-containing protein [Gaiellaceae bacterium]
MTSSTAAVLFRVLCVTAAVPLLVTSAVPRPEAHTSPTAALVLSAVAGALLFRVFVGRHRRVVACLRAGAQSVPALVPLVALGAATEESVWRLGALQGFRGVVGLPAAFVGSSLLFALAHGARALRPLSLHALSGAAFGAIFLATGRLTAAIAAHGTYNALVLAAAAGERRGASARAAAGRSAAHARSGTTDPTAQGPVAELQAVTKHFGAQAALTGLTMQVERGEVVALLGPNGAGKTTALSILLGLRRPDTGLVRVFGHDPRRLAVRRRWGCTPQETSFPPTLRVGEVIELVRRHYPRPAETHELLKLAGLTPFAHRQTGGLSGGERRRLAVALAFAGRPELVFLDEPSTGLDVESRHLLWGAIRRYAADGGTMLLTTHYLEEAEALASRVAVIAAGALVADGPTEAIRALTGTSRVRVAPPIPALDGVERIAEEGSAVAIYTKDPGGVVRQLVAAGHPLDDLEVTRSTLEEAFLGLTRSGT